MFLSNHSRGTLSALVLIVVFLASFPQADAQVTFFGHTYPENDFVWVLDQSCSMGWGTPVPMDQLKAEVTSAINQLAPSQNYNQMTCP